MPIRKNPICIIKGCVVAAKTRGLCNKCYSYANALVKQQKTTWEKLVEMGLAGERRKQSIYGAFARAFEEATKGGNDESVN